jgi:hypothetical protein
LFSYAQRNVEKEVAWFEVVSQVYTIEKVRKIACFL